MKRVFWFCPENDIALGLGRAGFTPPRQAALLARYGAPLMWWMGDEGDYVLLMETGDDGYREAFARWEEMVTSRFGQGPRFVSSLDGLDIAGIEPWGWSAYGIGRLLKSGAPRGLLAEAEGDMDKTRLLSHRRSAGLINDALAHSVDFGRYGQLAPKAALEAFALDDVRNFALDCAPFYVKSPWSSSGRGVVCSNAVPFDRLLERCDGIIRSQGSVMLEPAYDKVADFAMLFHADGTGGVRFHGYSRFFNTRDTSYAGNLIAPDHEIFTEISAMVPAPLLHDVRNNLERVLGDMTGTVYRGLMGVDMMVARDSSGRHMLVPCVELNLRMTMGHVAHAVYSRTLCRGIMKIAPAASATGAIFSLVPANDCFNISVVSSSGSLQ